MPSFSADPRWQNTRRSSRRIPRRVFEIRSSLSLVRLKCVLSVSPNSDLLARRRPRRRFLTVSKAPLGRRFLEELLCRLTFDLMIDAYKERAEKEKKNKEKER